MAVIKCKMCGGDLVLVEGQSVAECEYCGSKQTVPAADNEKKLIQFERAERLRKNCEFDKAAGLYEAIVSDFRQEAEAYWGLVLCKYGIEYVDDPATGKKIPTCHRSSFDSIMEDSDFEQALENADSVARRVYREEAKQIEEIRKGIIAVSANEQPYDIFICYKETDENGDRTLDSVLAQDIYDALTEKSYRTFFARISLEDKLGQEYEPCIFAALNSAKIMLAVGTDYEFYNAVWVKNEWSRYLKLMTKDKSKHLIPCFKGIDAYDMPKEFAKLQAQDLGKVGAMQDLLRGIEKILPKQKNTTVIQEKVVVGSVGGSNKVTALLERGNMALEDGDWAKADSFFEDVLNNDAKNAQAYIGKTLAQEKCRTLDALVRKRHTLYQNVRTEELEIPERTAYISGMVEKFALPGYLEAGYLRTLYDVDRTYDSEVSGRKQQYQDEKNWWVNHKLLSRAEKFAASSVAETLQQEKKHLFAQLNDRIKQAEHADAKNIAEMEQEYDTFLTETDAQAEKLHQDAISRREKDYQTWLEQAKTETEPKFLRDLADAFMSLYGYKDSKNLAEHCRKRAEEEQEKLDEAKARQRIQAEKKRKTQQRKTRAIAIILALAATTTIVVTKVIIPGNAYKEAEALAANGQYEEALKVYRDIGNYKDAEEKASLMYDRALEEARKKRDAQLAAEQEAKLAADRKAEEERLAKEYAAAEEYARNGEIAKAAIAFGKLGDYQMESDASWDSVAVRDVIGAGEWHTVALKSDGTVVAIGSNQDGQCDVIAWNEIIAISAGDDHTVGLKGDGTAVAVGNNSDGQCDISTWTDVVAIAAGAKHTLGLKRDGTVISTGYNKYGQCNTEILTDIVAVCAGYDTSVFLKSDGSVIALGDNFEGMCDVSGWNNITAVEAGLFHTVGLKADGTVVAKGQNKNGQCNVLDWSNIISISVGSEHTVGLKSDGTVVAVGDNSHGECNVGDWTNIVAISAGYQYTIGLKSDGSIVAVGSNANGKADVDKWKGISFGDIEKTENARVHSLDLWETLPYVHNTIDAGRYSTSALMEDGTAKVHGVNKWGVCDVDDWKDLVAISSGNTHTVGLKIDGTVVAVGYNDNGCCDTSDWHNIVAISAGGGHTVGLKDDGTVLAVGDNTYGQCDLSAWRDIVAIAAGDSHTVGLKSDGTVVAVGWNDDDQCDVSGWNDVVAIDANKYNTVALKSNGTVLAAGMNTYGQCDVSNWNDIVSICTGFAHTVGLKSDGTVLAVGSESHGKCEVQDWKNIVAIAANQYHTVGLKSDGTMVAVGYNSLDVVQNGKVVEKGTPGTGATDIHGWKDIKLPK